MGKWIREVLEPGSPEEPHIPLEDLAGLTEGALKGDKRLQSLAHVNRCSECYEILQQTLQDLPALEKPKSRLLSWYAMAASFLLLLAVGSGIYYSVHGPGQVMTASLELDNDLRNVLLGAKAGVWQDQDKVESLTEILREHGLKLEDVKQVALAKPYYPTKSLFGPKEILQITFEDGSLRLKVVTETNTTSQDNSP